MWLIVTVDLFWFVPDQINPNTNAEIILINLFGSVGETSVLLDGVISETDALNLLFTTDNGVFTENTVPKNTDSWPEVSCTSCHKQHYP